MASAVAGSYDAKIAICPSVPLKYEKGQGWLVQVQVWTENNGAIFDWTKNEVQKLSGKMFPRFFPINALIGGVERGVKEVVHGNRRLRLSFSQEQMEGSDLFEVEVKKVLSNTLQTMDRSPRTYNDYVTQLLDKKVQELKIEKIVRDPLDELICFFKTAFPLIRPWLDNRSPEKTAFIIKLCTKKAPAFIEADSEVVKSLINANNDEDQYSPPYLAYYKLLDYIMSKAMRQSEMKEVVSLIQDKRNKFQVLLGGVSKCCKEKLVEKKDPEDWYAFYLYSRDETLAYPSIFEIRKTCIAFATIFPTCMQQFEQAMMKLEGEDLEGKVSRIMEEAQMLGSLPLLDFFGSRHQRLCDAIQKGSREEVDAFFKKKIITLKELNTDQQFRCWAFVRHPEMVKCLLEKGFNFDVIEPEDQVALMEYAMLELSLEVVKALMIAGARNPNIFESEMATGNQKLKKFLRPYLVDHFFETNNETELLKITWRLIDNEAFEMIRIRFNFRHACSIYKERLRAFWFLTCKFKYIDTKSESFFTNLVNGLFDFKETIVRERLFLMAENMGHEAAVKYLEKKKGIKVQADPPIENLPSDESV